MAALLRPGVGESLPVVWGPVWGKRWDASHNPPLKVWVLTGRGECGWGRAGFLPWRRKSGGVGGGKSCPQNPRRGAQEQGWQPRGLEELRGAEHSSHCWGAGEQGHAWEDLWPLTVTSLPGPALSLKS